LGNTIRTDGLPCETHVLLSRQDYENRIFHATETGVNLTLAIVARHLKLPLEKIRQMCIEKARASQSAPIATEQFNRSEEPSQN